MGSIEFSSQHNCIVNVLIAPTVIWTKNHIPSVGCWNISAKMQHFFEFP